MREIRYQIDGGPVMAVPGGSAEISLTTEGAHSVQYNAVDNAGNIEAIRTLAVRIDKTAPAITSTQTPAANGAGWNNSDVTVQFTASDLLSGGTVCTVGSASLTAEGANQSVGTSCSDLAGNSAAASRSVSIDKTAPELILPTLASNYPSNSSLTLSFGATDGLSGIGSVSATLNGTPVSNGQTVILTQIGVNTFSLTAADPAGNSAGQTLTFTVQSLYQFSGFLPPLTADGRTVFLLGSVIPVKFQLTDQNGAPVSTAVAHLSVQQYSGANPVGDPIDATSVSEADSGARFRFDGSQYIYNLSTSPFSAGTWELRATLDDGSAHTIQIGLKSK